MAKKKHVKMSPAVITLKVSATIEVNLKDLKNDLDDTTPVILRAYVRPTLTQPGYFSVNGVFANPGALPPGDVKLTFADVKKVEEYTAKERGFHVLMLTTVEDGAPHTYRTGVFKVI